MESSCDIIPTTFIGSKKPSNSMPALSAAAGVQAAARHSSTAHLVEPDVAKLTEFFVTNALSKYSMNLGQFGSPRLGFFAAPQNVVLKKTAPISYLQHCAMRTLMMQQYAEEAITTLQAQGKQVQVIILGAGLSTLALRLRKQFSENQVGIVEVDHGEQREIKIESLLRLRNMGAHPMRPYGQFVNGVNNLHFVNGNFAEENWITDFFTQKKTLAKNIASIVIAERFMYLSQDEAFALLARLGELLTPDSKLIFGLSECVQKSSDFYNELHNGTNEAHRFALAPSDVPNFVKDQFFVESKIFSHDFVKQANLAMDSDEPQAKLPLEHYYVLGVRGSQQKRKLEEDDIQAIPTIRLKVPVPVPAPRTRDEEELARHFSRP